MDFPVWQELSDKAHELWQKHPEWDRAELLMHLRPKTRAAFLLAKFDTQVINGGLVQWVDNGYGSDWREVVANLNLHGSDLSAKAARTITTFMMEAEEMPPSDKWTDWEWDRLAKLSEPLDTDFYSYEEAWCAEIESWFANWKEAEEGGGSMTLRELNKLIEDLIEESDPDMEVAFAYPSGDHWRTTLASEVTDADFELVVHSDYHNGLRVCAEDDEPDEVREVVLLRGK